MSVASVSRHSERLVGGNARGLGLIIGLGALLLGIHVAAASGSALRDVAWMDLTLPATLMLIVWPPPAWAFLALGVAGLVGSGLDLVLWRREALAPRRLAAGVGLVLAIVSLAACYWGLQRVVAQPSLMGYGIVGVVGGGIFATVAAGQITTGWRRLLVPASEGIVTTPRDEHKLDGLKGILMGIVVCVFFLSAIGLIG